MRSLPLRTPHAMMMEQPMPRAAEWNPQGVPLPVIAVADYCSAAPPYLDGSLAGDRGFDPLCLVALASPSSPGDILSNLSAADRRARIESMTASEQQQAVEWMRTAELKHARLAMLCAAGWPISELVSGEFLKYVTNGRAPSLLNGGLVDSPGGNFVTFVFAIASLVELSSAYYGANGGDYDFDPLGISSGEGPLPSAVPNVGQEQQLRLAELKNGRLAMVAVAGYVAQELALGNPVVEQTPWLFGRW